MMCFIEAVKTEVFFTSLRGRLPKRRTFEWWKRLCLKVLHFHLKNGDNEEGSE